MDRRQAIEVNGVARGVAEVAVTRRRRALGLLGSGAGPVLVLVGTRSVHTFAMPGVLDVALCSADGRVGAVLAVAPNRVTRPRPGLTTVIEAPAGTFDRWGLRVGDLVTLGPAGSLRIRGRGTGGAPGG